MIAAWAREEVEGVDFGDERLDARMAVLLSELGNRPNLSIPAACEGRAEMEAAYRFFDNPKVSFQKVLAPHVRRTRERIAAQETVLLVQDSSEIDLTRLGQEVAGAGRLDHSRRGVLLHPLHAFTPDGTPLGTVWAQCQNRTEPKLPLFVCRMGREAPDADCQMLFEPSEWKAVWTAVHRTHPPKQMPRLGEVVLLIAQLGRYVRRGDSKPGPQTMWIGLQRMYDLAWAWDAFGPLAPIRDG